MTELEAAAIANEEMQSRGGRPTFCIVATGANSGEPHHSPDDTAIAAGDVVLLDFGCNHGGYESDITRVFCMGKPDAEAEQVYRIVFAAHHAARACIRPGVTCEEIDQAAREVIVAAGYGDQFVHRTGHGIGMQGHEDPYIVAGNTQPVAPGDCFSIEPGIYLAGQFGVRIENIVTVTEDGYSSLNEEPTAVLAN